VWQGSGGNQAADATVGSLALLPGSGEIAYTTADRYSYYSSAVSFASNTDGSHTGGISVFQDNSGGDSGTFSKGGGLGDLELLCAPAPLEIGNYVWCDSLQNGIQDACERGIDGITVELYDDAGILVGVTTTANGGQYYFNQNNVDTLGVNANGSPSLAYTGMNYSSEYFIVFGNSQFAGGAFTVGSETYNGVTPVNDVNGNANDNVDSDVNANNLTSGSLGSRPDGLHFIAMTTDATGCGDHKFDMGLNCCATPDAPVIAVTDNDCDAGTPGTFTVTTSCGAGSSIEWSTDSGTTWSTTAPTYDNATAQTVIARCVNDTDNTCISAESTAVTSAPNDCCPNPNCFGISIQQN